MTDSDDRPEIDTDDGIPSVIHLALSDLLGSDDTPLARSIRRMCEHPETSYSAFSSAPASE